MNLIQMNYLDYNPKELHSGIITDIPYKNSIKNKLNEENFNVNDFLNKCNKITIDCSYIITFCNMMNLMDLIKNCEKYNYKFITYQIWNKTPIRNWISWNLPLKTHELICYLSKGNFKFDFKNGIIKPKVNRKSFGGSLKTTAENKNEFSYGMYEDIITIQKPRTKIHPTIKPVEFSQMFYNIVKNDSQKNIIDLFCGSGNLLTNFENGIGLDIIKYWSD